MSAPMANSEATPTDPTAPNSWSATGAFLVLGAAGGIGAAVARSLLTRGARVVLAARNPERLQAIDFDARARAASCDVTVPEQIDECLRVAGDLGGTVAGIALCVGSILLKPAHLTSDTEWQDVLARNLTAAFHVARAAGKVMRQGGSVVFCSSAAASTGLANHDAIAAAKAGVEGLVRSAAATYASRGLRFNAVAPGLVRTKMAEPITSNERALEASRSMHALGRIGEPEDVASAIVWLLDPANSWTSGHVLRVDGGLARLRPVARR
ncbi:MAG: SDR family oxidoreductase [Planctomycetota bacterium]